MSLTEREWAILTGQVARSDDLATSLKEALDDSTRIATVPVTQEMPNGVKKVVGHAQIHRDGENVLATFTMQSSSVSKHLGGVLGPFSIGGPWAVQGCFSHKCLYNEPHKHGFACTKQCECNRHGRVD